MRKLNEASNRLDYIVLGGGPAGIQAAYFLQQAGLSFAVLERDAEVGSFFRRYPRHRRLLSINKIYTGYDDPETNLRWDWNSLISKEYSPLFKEFSAEYFPDADAFVHYLRAFVTKHDIPIDHGVHVSNIERLDDSFLVQASDSRTWKSEHLIVATGIPEEYTPDIPGVELCERYGDVSIDPQDFEGQRVLVIGKGNSAFETADNLVATASLIHLASPAPIRMAWRTHFVGDLRAVNNNLLDNYQLKLQNAVLDGDITNIRRDGDRYKMEIRYAHADGEVEALCYDRIILCTGFRMDTSVFAESVHPTMTSSGRLPVQTSSWESVNVPGLYFAGTLMQQRDHKKYMSAFIHGFRYNIQALMNHLLAEHHDASWPRTYLDYSGRAVTDALIAQMNQSSAIWQQPGFLANILRIHRDARQVEMFDFMPVDYALEHFSGDGTLLTLTLEYGENDSPDPFYVERVHRQDVERASASKFLHPVVRCFERGELVSAHHVLEDLAAEWKEPEHVEPLYEYLLPLFTVTSMVTGPVEESDQDAASRAQRSR